MNQPALFDEVMMRIRVNYNEPPYMCTVCLRTMIDASELQDVLALSLERSVCLVPFQAKRTPHRTHRRSPHADSRRSSQWI